MTVARRPRAVTVLACGVFIMGGVNAARVWVYLSDWTFWAGFNAPFALPARLALSIVWALALIAVAVGLWIGLGLARRAALFALPVYIAFGAAWSIVFARGDYERGRASFLIGLSAIAILLVAWILTRDRVRTYFEMERPVEGLDV